VRPPHRQQRGRVPAADPDDVLGEHEAAQIGDRALEKPQDYDRGRALRASDSTKWFNRGS